MGATELEYVLYGQEHIAVRVQELGLAVRKLAEGCKKIHFVAVPQGALVFFDALLREVYAWEYDPVWERKKPVFTIPYTSQWANAQSYKGGLRGTLSLTWAGHSGDGAPVARRGECVVIVDDIADSGATLSAIREQVVDAWDWGIYDDEPAVYSVVLLRRASCPVETDLTGFVLENDHYIYGYGMDDADGLAREKPYIAYKE